MSSPVSLPSFPSTWTAPASCFATTNYFRVLLGSGYFSNMYGTPTPVLTGNYPTGDCFPPSTTPGVPWLTDGPCPSGYTRACATAGPESNGKPISTVTCCPSVTDNVFSFMCRENEYGCHATATSGVVWTGVITDIGLETPTERPVTRKPSTDEGIEAWGIKLISVAAESRTTDTSSTPSKTGDAQPEQLSGQPGQLSGNGGLSAGAKAGIAVGAVVGVALLALGAFLVFRRRKRRDDDTTGEIQPNVDPPIVEAYGVTDKHELAAPVQPRQLDTPAQRPIWELQG